MCQCRAAVLSEQAADHAGIAGAQPLQTAQGFLRGTVRCGMVEEAVESLCEGKRGVVPMLAEHAFGQAFAAEFASPETDENGDLAIMPDDDGGVVMVIRDDHGVIVPVRPAKVPRSGGPGWRYAWLRECHN